MNAKTNQYRVDIASEWRNVLKTPANLHLLSTQLSVLCAMAEADAEAERNALREEVAALRAVLRQIAGHIAAGRLYTATNEIETALVTDKQ